MIFTEDIIVKIIALLCSIATSLFSQYPTASLVVKNTSDSQKMAETEAMAEVEVFIKELYEAQTNRDVYWIRERLDDDDVIDWAIALSIIYSKDFGFQKYDNVEVKVYTTSSEDYFVSVAAYDMVIEWNGEELVLPGIESSVIWQNENSQWGITYEHSLSDELIDEIYQLMTSDELVDWFDSISKEFYYILACRPDLAVWLSEVWPETAQKVVSETLLKNDTWDENDVWDYLFGEENGVPNTSYSEEEDRDSIYIVQEGDSLWSIAKREFGDGMYWVKLYEANRDVIGENPDLLLVGTELDLVYEED